MASYSMSNHTLHFENDYESLVVRDGDNEVVDSYDLTNEDQSISVAVTGSSYSVAVASDFETPTHQLDVDGGDSASFQGTELDGIVIVDIRDINKLANGQPSYTLTYDLTCTTFYLKYVAGAFGFKIYFTGSCFVVG
jgi:hypothetical protein